MPLAPTSRLPLALLLASLTACQTEDSEPLVGEVQQVSYEVIPTPLYELDMHLTLENATYAEREAFTVEVRDALLHDVVAAVGLADQMLDTKLTPGGYQLVTNPSLQTRLMASDAQVVGLAAALGYVFSQWSVLVTDFADTAGGTGYAVVAFDGVDVDADLGQQFFQHAAEVDGGLGGGYFAFAGQVIYLNIRGSDGAPYSGLEDQEFTDALAEAAETFAPFRAELAQSGEAAVIFVENDWATAPAGEDYLAILDELGDDVVAELGALQDEHVDRFNAAVAANGWQ